MLMVHTGLQEVFTEIYIKHLWGGPKDRLYSGPGSHDVLVTQPYVEKVTELSNTLAFRNKTFVDLGCGDYAVGSQLRELCSRYIGVDVVKDVVEENQRLYGNTQTTFLHLDVTCNKLPDGDVCFVRQVLQHLSNNQISTVLRKIKMYPVVIITEHLPSHGKLSHPNKDKIAAGNIRLDYESGIYLTQPPFNLPTEQVELVLECSAGMSKQSPDPGVISTFVYRPNSVL